MKLMISCSLFFLNMIKMGQKRLLKLIINIDY